MSPTIKNVKPSVTVSTVNRLAWTAGFEGVAGLARHIRRNRVTVWNAVRFPDRHTPTFNKIVEALTNGPCN
jgi:DNA-binding MurR/RpiR family transcriptional regulator